MPQIVVKSYNVEHAEFLNPQHSVMSLRLAEGRWIELDKFKDQDSFEAVLGFANRHPEMLTVWAFGERAAREEARMREIARQEIERREAEERAAQHPALVPVAEIVAPPAPPSPSGSPASPETATTIINSENDQKPTVEVELPVVMPPAVEVKVVETTPEIVSASAEPQVMIEVVPVDVSQPLAPDTVVTVVETPQESQANIAVISTPANQEQLEALKIPPADIVAQAIAAAAPELPPVEQTVVAESAPIAAAVEPPTSPAPPTPEVPSAPAPTPAPEPPAPEAPALKV